ncbi:MAG: peptidoglycan-binding protein [Patescibacteria group bacterium]
MNSSWLERIGRSIFVSVLLLSVILSGFPEVQVQAATTSLAAASQSTVLTVGATSGDVGVFQAVLQKLGYLNSTPTGYYGTQTKAAVAIFQKFNRLPVTGSVDDRTRYYLGQAIAQLGVKAPVLTTTSSVPAKIRTTLPPTPVTTPVATAPSTTTLKVRSTGGKVTEVQKSLNTLGLLAVEPTGYFGTLTEAAVKKFQTNNLLPVTGQVDTTTNQILTTTASTVPLADSTTKTTTTTTVKTAPAKTPPPAPADTTLTFSSSDSSVVVGTSYTLRWSSQHAESCTASGEWSGTFSTKGSKTFTPTTEGTRTYILTCYGKSGSVVGSQTVVVTANTDPVVAPPPAPAPSLTFTATPTTVTSGGSTTLTWTTKDATSCTGTGDGITGTQPTSKTVTVSNITSDRTFSLSCTGAGGTVAKSLTVTVTEPTPVPTVAPTLIFSASATSVFSGGNVTLTWSTTNATSCTGTGQGIVGTQPTSKSVSVSNITSNQTYSLTCTGAGGSITKSITVVVTGPAPLTGVVSEGDSISVFWSGNHTGIYAAANPTVPFKGLAVGGSGIGTLTARQQAVLDAKPKVFTVFIGANDLTSYSSATAFTNALFSYVATIKATGAKVAVATILPQQIANASANNALHNTRRVEANNIIRAAVGGKIDGVIDFAADPTMGPDSAAANTTLYYDGLHPTDGNSAGTGGQNKLALVYGPVVNALLNGTPVPTPSPYITPTLTFTASASSVTSGGSVDLTWSTTNATSCTGTGQGIAGMQSTSKTTTVSNITSNQTFSLTCTGAGGSVTKSVSVTVLAPQPSPSTIPASIPSNFDINSELVPSWGTGAIPASAAPDVVGAFRFICNASHESFDDPIVYPGQPGKSHLHEFFGNTLTNANSTYQSLRTTGNSTCNSPLNRSGYWIPAMINGAGQVVRPDYVSIYYKRRPDTDPLCTKIGKSCVDLPRGLRFVFGANLVSATPTTGGGYFNCTGPTATSGHYKDIATAAKNCPAGNQIGAIISAPECWDGVNLDSADHRSHVAYSQYIGQSYAQCPSTHPYVIPTFTLGAWYTVDSTLDRSGTWNPATPTWHLSSDGMPNATKNPGSTLHSDWFGAWDDTVKAMWEQNCVNKLLNCSGGDLGNGKQLKMFKGFSWTANPRTVPIPAGGPMAYIPNHDFKIGTKGPSVTALQNLLKNLGFFKEQATGYFGTLTQAALKSYQSSLAGVGAAGTEHDHQ